MDEWNWQNTWRHSATSTRDLSHLPPAVILCTLLLYDWLPNLDREVAFIWRSPWSWGRLTYHLTRAWPAVFAWAVLPVILFLPFPSLATCNSAVCFYTFGAVIELGIMSSVMVMRCCALYHKRCVLWLLFAGLSCAIIYAMVMAVYLLKASLFLVNPLPSIFSGCIVILPSNMWMLYIIPTIFESSLLFLTLLKIWRMSRDYGVTQLAQLLAQHGTAYFALLVVLIVFICVGAAIYSVEVAFGMNGEVELNT